jgi:hypothetical protein
LYDYATSQTIGPLEPKKLITLKPCQPSLFSSTVGRLQEIIGAEKFFLALPEILPLPVNLRFEGTSMSPDALALFACNAAAHTLEIPPGTIRPKPSMFHVHATEQFLQQLAALAGKHAEAEVCDHFHAYSNSQGLMQWYDAFSGDPLLVEESIPEAKVQGFCRKLGAKYARWRAPIGHK